MVITSRQDGGMMSFENELASLMGFLGKRVERERGVDTWHQLTKGKGHLSYMSITL